MALVPVYLLQVCYGMNTGFPAILTPQLREHCSEFPISLDQESWIVSISILILLRQSTHSGNIEAHRLGESVCELLIEHQVREVSFASCRYCTCSLLLFDLLEHISDLNLEALHVNWL